jgi:hypothetical protein
MSVNCNTIYSCTYGLSIDTPNSNATCSDNISLGCSSANWGVSSGSFASATNNMGASGDSVYGTSSQVSIAATEFVNTGTYDLHIKDSARARRTGTALGSPYDIDIDGVTCPTAGYDIGADQTGINIVAMSVGTKTPISGGTITVVDSTHVTLVGGSFDSNWGEGDQITIDSEICYVLSRTDSTHLVLQVGTSKTGSGLAYTIQRSYSTLGLWNNGQCCDLTATDTIQKAVMYKESDPGGVYCRETNGTWHNSSATNYIWITTAVSDRHTGIEGTGVVIDCAAYGAQFTMWSEMPYTEYSWFEIKKINHVGADHLFGFYMGYGIAGAHYTQVHHCILHGDDNAWGFGIYGHRDNANSCIFYRNICYNLIVGIEAFGSSSYYKILDNTIYGCTYNIAIQEAYSNTLQMTNNISLGAVTNDFYNRDGGSSYAANSGYNIYASGDVNVPGTNNQISTAANEFLIVTDFNLHLKAGAVAIGNGLNLGSPYDIDIDAQTVTPPWDIGADQYTAITPSGNWFLLNTRNELAYSNRMY